MHNKCNKIPCVNDACACLRDCGTRIPNHFSGSCCGLWSLLLTGVTSRALSLLALLFASFSVISFFGLFLLLTPVKLNNKITAFLKIKLYINTISNHTIYLPSSWGPILSMDITCFPDSLLSVVLSVENSTFPLSSGLEHTNPEVTVHTYSPQSNNFHETNLLT